MSDISNTCKECPASIFNDWRQRGLRIRGELRRHQITDRERRIAEIILDQSFGWGRPCVVVPQLKFFASLTGMAVPHVHEAITGLHLKRIIRVVQVKGQMTYCVREDTEVWKVAPRASMDSINETVSLLRELNDLPPLPRAQEELPNFKVQFVTKLKAACVTKTVIPDEIPWADEQLPFLT